MSDDSTEEIKPPGIPDHDLLRCIGKGAFGEVWLARSQATARYRAVKVVRRSQFDEDRPYEIEFEGVRKFEEISLEHEGFIDVLHITRNDREGYFAYVMELADDLETGAQIDPARYVPRTLAREITHRRRLSPAECVRVALSLATALGELHRRGLVHRDIKPANIVFVRNAPKLADVGLVAELKGDKTVVRSPPTFIGTLVYMDPVFHGAARGDLYSLGKVIYQMATGQSAERFPALPDDLAHIPDLETFWELNEIFSRLCDHNLSRRYPDARELEKALRLLSAGPWVPKARRWEWLRLAVRRYGVFALVLLLLGGLAAQQWMQRQKQAAELRQRQAGYYVAYGNAAVNARDLPGALPWFAEALRLDADRPENVSHHRLRFGAVVRACPTIVQMWFTKRSESLGQFAGTENQVLCPQPEGRWAVHDLASGRPLYPSIGDDHYYEVARLCPRTRQAVTSAYTNSIAIWDWETGRLIRRLSDPDPRTHFNLATLDPSGRRLAALETWHPSNWLADLLQEDGFLPGHAPWHQGKPPQPVDPPAATSGHWAESLREINYWLTIWTATNAQARPRRIPLASEPLHLSFSPKGDRIVVSTKNGCVIVQDLEALAVLSHYTPHRSWVYYATFSPDGSQVASASYDRTVMIWNATNGNPVVPPMRHGDGIRSVEFSPDGRLVVTAGLDFMVCIWDTATGRLLGRLPHNAKALHATFSPSGRHLVTVAYDGVTRVWDLRRPPSEALARLAALSGDGRRWLSVTPEGLMLRDLATGREGGRRAMPLKAVQWCLLDHAGHHAFLAVARPAEGMTNQVELQRCRIHSNDPIERGPLLPDPSSLFAISADGRFVISTNHNQTAWWDFESKRVLYPSPRPATAAAFNATGDRVAIAVDRAIQFWDTTTPVPTLVTNWPLAEPIEFLAWAGGDRLLLSRLDQTFEPKAAEIRRYPSGELVGQPLRHRDGVTHVALSPDGRKAITSSEDFTAMIWDTDTGRKLTPPLVHDDQVFCAVFDETGRRVATACKDGSVRVWDTRTGEPLTPPLAHPDNLAPAVRVAFAPQGRQLCVQFRGGAATVWDLELDTRPVEDLVKIAELLSAQQSQQTETMMPQSDDGLRERWTQLRTRYPEDFSFRP